MGNVPRPKPFLLRRPAYDGAACSGLLRQRDFDHWHELFVLRVRVSHQFSPATPQFGYSSASLTNCMLLCVSSCPYLSRRVTPVIPIISGVLFLFVVGTLFKTSFTDPGIIPRATADEAAYIEKQVCECLGLDFLINRQLLVIWESDIAFVNNLISMLMYLITN